MRKISLTPTGNCLIESDTMIIESLVAPPLQTNAYVLGCEKTKKGVIVDPGMQTKWHLLEITKKHGLTIEAIWLTHTHFDHIADVFELKTLHEWPVYVHELDAENLRNPGSDGIPNMMGLKPVQPDGFFIDGEDLHIGALRAQVIHTPGHSPGGVCFYFPEEKVLISGDTLFKGTYGRVDLSYSSATDMKASLQRLKQLPDDVKVYPGHGTSTTMGEEKRHRWLQ